MATLALTIPAGRGGADLRRFAEKIQEASMNVPDQVSTGAALTVTIDNAPARGLRPCDFGCRPRDSDDVHGVTDARAAFSILTQALSPTGTGDQTGITAVAGKSIVVLAMTFVTSPRRS
jgi:hypothetical protein